jgi:serine protease
MIRPVALLSILVLFPIVFTSAQPRGAPQKTRVGDVPTPGILLPIRTSPPVQISIDASGVTVSPPAVWEKDPVTGAEYRRDELLVRFTSGADARVRLQALQANRASRVARILAGGWEVARLEPGTTAAEAMAGLSRHAAVDAVALNYRLTTQQVRPNDESYPLQWNFDAVRLPFAWEINPGGRRDVVVAVIDSGLNTFSDTVVFSSPFLGDVAIRFGAVPDLIADGSTTAPFDFVYGDDLPVDLDGHGTHVAGTIAQQTNNNIGVAGVAYNVRLMPLKVLADSWDVIFGSAFQGGTVSIIAEAVRYAADNGAKVINLSLGTLGAAPPLRDAIEYAVGRGAFVAMAAGNEAEDGNPVVYPAAYAAEIDGAMAVGAVNRSGARAIYSSFHPYVEICAPGGESFDFQGGVTQVVYEEASTLSFLSLPEKFVALDLGFRPRFDRFELRPFAGTSMATPHVSGIAALLYSQGIRNPAAIEEAIARFAGETGASEEECGAGIVDARRALRGLGLGR